MLLAKTSASRITVLSYELRLSANDWTIMVSGIATTGPWTVDATTGKMRQIGKNQDTMKPWDKTVPSTG